MKQPAKQREKFSFKQIVQDQDNWVRYQQVYADQVSADQIAEEEKMGRLAQALGRAIYRLGWRQRIRPDFKRDPLPCPCCGPAQMELFRLTIRPGTRLITLGGLKWLLARGRIVAVPDPDPPPLQGQPHPLQLGFAFLRSP